MYNTSKGSMNYCSKRTRKENRERNSESRGNCMPTTKGCGHRPQNSCGCGHRPQNSCGCGHRPQNSCGCGYKPQNSCGCGKNVGCNNKPEVVYYPCKEADCDNYIDRTNNLIGELSCKTNSLNENLMLALEDQGLVGQELSSIKGELASIGNALEVLKNGLCAAQNALNNVVEDIDENVIYNQANAANAINNAIDDEECIDNILDCLEEAVNDAFECLEDTGCPVLVPKPSKDHGCGCGNHNFQHNCEDDCDCD